MQTNHLEAIPRPLVIIAWILVFGSAAPMLDSTMVNIAIHQLGSDMHTTLSMVQWAITGFLLAMGIAVPFSGWLINYFPGKRVYLVAEIAFGLTSLLSGISWNIGSLIAFRLLQGLASGVIMTIFITILVDSVGGNRVGRIMAIVGVPMTLGPMVGPIIGGLLVQYASWRWIFFINVPIVIAASILLIMKVPDIPAKNQSATIDLPGILLLAGSSTAIIYGVVQASNHGNFTNTDTVRYIGLGIILLVAYLIYAHFKQAAAVIPLNLFAHRNFTGSMIGTFLAGFITSGPMILLPLFFQDVRGESVVMAAISLIPQSIGMLISRGTIGRLIDSIGARWVVMVGVVITVASTLPFAFFDSSSAYLWIAIAMFIRGIGGAAVKTATQADAFVGMDKAQSAPASMSSNIFQQVGSAFASAVLATIVAGYIASHPVTSSAQLVSAYQQGFLWATIFTVLCFIPALMLTNRIGQKTVA